MELQTKTTGIGSLKALFKKHFNTPMMLVLIYCLVNFGFIIKAVLNIFTTLISNPTLVVWRLQSAIVACGPLVLLVLLWLHRFERIKKPSTWMGVLSSVAAVLTVTTQRGTMIMFFENMPTNFYELISVSPFLSILNTALTAVVYLILGINLLRKKKNGALAMVCYVLAIGVTLFFGILTQMTGDGSLIKAFVTAMYFIALLNIPMLIQEPRSKEIGKNTGLVALVVIVVIIYVISGAITGTIGGGGGSSSSNTCRSCGRSFQAGDSGGNFLNIAGSGMCNNCESNFHSLEDFLD